MTYSAGFQPLKRRMTIEAISFVCGSSCPASKPVEDKPTEWSANEATAAAEGWGFFYQSESEMLYFFFQF